MDDNKKILQAILSGQNALKQELVGKIDKLGDRLDGRIDGLETRIDGLEVKIDKVEKNLTKKLFFLSSAISFKFGFPATGVN